MLETILTLYMSTLQCKPDVEWVYSPLEVREVLDEYNERTGTIARGLARWNDSKCTIYAFPPPDPSIKHYRHLKERHDEILRHEYLHCVAGHFHE